jgi:hypothetical protein
MPLRPPSRKLRTLALSLPFDHKERFRHRCAWRYAPGSLLSHLRTAVASKTAEKIDALEQRLRQLKVQRTRTEARKRTQEARRTRREDTRRKILVGAVVLAKVDQGVMDPGLLEKWLDGALKREDDRKLFGL